MFLLSQYNSNPSRREAVSHQTCQTRVVHWAMSWYSKPSKWWESEKEWREKGWNEKGETGEWSQKDDWKAKAGNEWISKGDKGDWKGDWSEWSKERRDWKDRDWKDWRAKEWKAGDKSDRRHQWVAKSEKPRPEKSPETENIDPAEQLEGALADVEELLGERLTSTRELLEDSHRNAKESVRLVTHALELLSKKTVDCKNQEDLNDVMRAKKSVRELLMWRNFGLKMWLHNKPDPMNFQTYDAEVQNDLKQTWTKIEQKLMQELIAGDSWSKLARKLRFCVGNQEFSAEMRTLLTRILTIVELTSRARQKKSASDNQMSEGEQALFEEMAADDAFGEEVIRAVRNDRFRQQQEAIYPAYAPAGPSWMQQMLGWHIPPANVPNGSHFSPMQSIPQTVPGLAVSPWGSEPWWGSTVASSSSAPVV